MLQMKRGLPRSRCQPSTVANEPKHNLRIPMPIASKSKRKPNKSASLSVGHRKLKCGTPRQPAILQAAAANQLPDGCSLRDAWFCHAVADENSTIEQAREHARSPQKPHEGPQVSRVSYKETRSSHGPCSECEHKAPCAAPCPIPIPYDKPKKTPEEIKEEQSPLECPCGRGNTAVCRSKQPTAPCHHPQPHERTPSRDPNPLTIQNPSPEQSTAVPCISGRSRRRAPRPRPPEHLLRARSLPHRPRTPSRARWARAPDGCRRRTRPWNGSPGQYPPRNRQ